MLENFKIWDDLLDEKFLMEIDDESNYYSWDFGNTSGNNSWPYGNKGGHRFWGCSLFRRISSDKIINNCPDQIYNLYLHLTQNIIKQNFQLEQISLNAQSLGQDGSTHIDNLPNNNFYTLMVFITSKWEESWGGNFQLLKSQDSPPEIVKSITYKPGRIVLFDSGIPHRGLAPIVPKVLRKSLVFRLKKL